MNNQQQKKKTPITAIVMFALSVLSAVALVGFLIDSESIDDIIVSIIWLIGFSALGVLSLKSSAKSLGWLAGALGWCGGLISHIINSNYPGILGGIILTIVFVVIFIIKNIKHKK